MKHITEQTGPANTSVLVLFSEGQHAGKIIAAWSQGTSGPICRAAVLIWAGPLKGQTGPAGQVLNYSNVGTSTGAGSNLLSEAIYKCMVNAGYKPQFSPGSGRHVSEFEALGYQVFEIL